MERIPILGMGKLLLVTIQVDMHDRLAMALQDDLTARISGTGARGVLLDISSLEIVDSFIGRMISNIAAMARVLDAETVVVGMRPAVAITLVELGLSLPGVRTALNVEKGMALLRGLTGPLDYADPIALQRMFPARLEVEGDARLVVFAPGARAASVVRGERMVSATRNVAGFLEFVEERHGPVISAITWSGPGSLTVRGTLVGGTTGEAVLRQYPQPGAPVERGAPLTIEGETYAFEIDASSLTAHHAEPWHLLVPVGDRLLTQTFDRTRAADFAAARQVGEGRDDERRVEVLLTRNDVVRIGVR